MYAHICRLHLPRIHRCVIKTSGCGTNFTEQRPSSEADRSSATQEIPCILWNLKVHHCIHNSQHETRVHSCTCTHLMVTFTSTCPIFQLHCQHTTNCTKWLLVSACSSSHHQGCHFAKTVDKNLTANKAMR
jgi:hypothetical protein